MKDLCDVIHSFVDGQAIDPRRDGGHDHQDAAERSKLRGDVFAETRSSRHKGIPRRITKLYKRYGEEIKRRIGKLRKRQESRRRVGRFVADDSDYASSSWPRLARRFRRLHPFYCLSNTQSANLSLEIRSL